MQIALALFVVSTAALALLVQVVSFHSKSDLLMRAELAGVAYPRQYALELEPAGEESFKLNPKADAGRFNAA